MTRLFHSVGPDTYILGEYHLLKYAHSAPVTCSFEDGQDVKGERSHLVGISTSESFRNRLSRVIS